MGCRGSNLGRPRARQAPSQPSVLSFVWGSRLAVLRAYPWFCLCSKAHSWRCFRDPVCCRGSKLGQQHARREPELLCYHSRPRGGGTLLPEVIGTPWHLRQSCFSITFRQQRQRLQEAAGRSAGTQRTAAEERGEDSAVWRLLLGALESSEKHDELRAAVKSQGKKWVKTQRAFASVCPESSPSTWRGSRKFLKLQPAAHPPDG